jgi:hypothetical protein
MGGGGYDDYDDIPEDDGYFLPPSRPVSAKVQLK